MVKHILSRLVLPLVTIMALAVPAFAQRVLPAPPTPTSTRAASTKAASSNAAASHADAEMESLSNPALIYKVEGLHSRLEMTVHTTRIFTMERQILQAQVHNDSVLTVTPLSPNQIQVSAKATGVTQVNLWGEDQKVRTVQVIVFADVQELSMILRASFPHCALKVMPVKDSVMISGYIDKPEYSSLIMKIAEEYYPKVINAMTVGGVEQVLLQVKVMEVSRTKLRRLGIDFSNVDSSGSVITSGASGLLTSVIDTTPVAPSTALAPAAAWSPITSGGSGGRFAFGIVNGGSAFLGVIDALRQDNLLKVKSEPNLVAISGETAEFNAGGQIPVPVPQSLGTVTVEWKDYGTMVKFVPIVLGNGKIRLQIRPEVSDLDASRSQVINGSTVPGIRTRWTQTCVEMVAGQTLAIAGLVQCRSESHNFGLPWISELPYVGALFRNVKNEINEIELLIMVTPELVEPLDVNEVPLCGPGSQTADPSDWALFAKGHIEVPKCCPNKNGDSQPPPDGMIGSPNTPSPNPADSGDANGTGSYNRYPASNQNSAPGPAAPKSQDNPPGFIGPAGYDVVK